MFRRVLALSAIATVALTTGARAAEHTVMIFDTGFFPVMTFAVEGDTIRFVNSSTQTAQAIAKNSSWSTGDLAANEAYVLPIVAGITQDFYSKYHTSVIGGIALAPPPPEAQ